MDVGNIPLFLALVFVAYSGSYSGKLLLGKFSTDTFRKIVLVIIAITGLLQIITFFK
jgi:uncharacterized membrane protein YfcA